MRLTNLVTLGDLVRKRRTDLGLTQGQAAKLIGVGRRSIIELEGGKRSVGFGTVLKTLSLLGLDLFAEPRGTDRRTVTTNVLAGTQS